MAEQSEAWGFQHDTLRQGRRIDTTSYCLQLPSGVLSYFHDMHQAEIHVRPHPASQEGFPALYNMYETYCYCGAQMNYTYFLKTTVWKDAANVKLTVIPML